MIKANSFLNLPAHKKNQEIFWRFFEALFLLVVFYAPFQLALNLGPDIDLASIRILILGLFLIWLFGATFFKKRIFISSFQGFSLIAFFVIAAISLFAANELDWGWRKLLFLFSIFPLYFVSASFLSSFRNLKKIITAFLSVAVLSAGLGLIQFLGQFFLGFQALFDLYSKKIGPIFWGQAFSSLVSDYPSWFVNVSGQTIMRAFGLFPDPHMMAFFLGLVLPIALSLWLFGKKNKATLFLICGLLFVALLLTFSRGGYLGIIFAVLLILFLGWRFLKEKTRLILIISTLFICLILAVFAQPAISRLVSSFSFSEGSSIGRMQIWQEAWQISLKNPLLGVGFGNYSREVNPLASYRNPITSHNLYLDIFSETGIFGLAVWLFLIFGSLFQLIKSLKKYKGKKPDDFLPALNIGLAGSLGYFLIHSFFETAMFNPVILAFLMIILGITSSVVCYEHLN